MTHIIFITKGTGGDVFPLIDIGRDLQARGHVVTLASHCVYENLAQAANMEFIPLDTLSQYEYMQKEMSELLHPPSALLFHRRHVLPRILNECRLIEQHIQDQDTIIVSHSTTLFTALIVSESLKIPVVLTFLSPHQVKMLSFFTGLLGALADEFNLLRNSLALPAITNWSAWLRSFQKGIGVWPDWLALPEPNWPTNLSPVGFVLEQTIPLKEDELPMEARACWDGGRACILITHGTSEPLEPAFFENSVAACLQLGYNGVIVTPEGYATVLPQLSSQIKWFELRLLVSLLPYVQAIIHHGGIGTAAQALLTAKPQLIMGYGFDRLENARLFQRLGIAECLSHEEWKPDLIAAALQRLTTSSTVSKRCMELAQRMSQENSLSMASNAIETTKMDSRFTVPESSPDLYAKIEHSRMLEGLSEEKRKLLALRLKQKNK